MSSMAHMKLWGDAYRAYLPIMLLTLINLTILTIHTVYVSLKKMRYQVEKENISI